MPHAAYPTTEEFEVALTESGLMEFAPSDLGGALQAAIATWERDTDWGPFLSSGDEEARRFTLIGGKMLFLKSGLVEAPSLFTVDGRELVLNQTYWLEPANHAPYTKVLFGLPVWSLMQGCVIIGKWGYCSEVPNDVWQAILNKAALNMSDQIQRKWNETKTAEINASGIVKAKESGPLRMEFQRVDGSKTLDLSATFEAWKRSYSAALVGRVMVTP
jgi:hypothetical protein